jgi:hypothetical protein
MPKSPKRQPVMKVVGLRRIESYPHKLLYQFNLALAGFIINGFVYNAESGSVMAPSYRINGRRIRVVKAFGMQWKRLKLLLVQELASRQVQLDQPHETGESCQQPTLNESLECQQHAA